jgi:hypothetical protein
MGASLCLALDAHLQHPRLNFQPVPTVAHSCAWSARRPTSVISISDIWFSFANADAAPTGWLPTRIRTPIRLSYLGDESLLAAKCRQSASAIGSIEHSLTRLVARGCPRQTKKICDRFFNDLAGVAILVCALTSASCDIRNVAACSPARKLCRWPPFWSDRRSLVDVWSARGGLVEICQKVLKKTGAPYGNRTRVSAVKGRRPRPLDEGRAKRRDI